MQYEFEKMKKYAAVKIGKLDFLKFLFNSRESNFSKPEVKTRKIKAVGFSRKYRQIKAWVMPKRKSAYSFLIF
jgi:hypothetical protein